MKAPERPQPTRAYRIIRRNYRSGKQTIMAELDAVNDAEARAKFSEFINEMLAEDDSGHFRFVNFERWLGGWIDETLARPVTDEDILPTPPAWYISAGIYDDNCQQITSLDDDIDCLDLRDNYYFVTHIKPKGD